MWADAVKRDLWPPLHSPVSAPGRQPEALWTPSLTTSAPPLWGDVDAQPEPGDLPRQDEDHERYHHQGRGECDRCR